MEIRKATLKDAEKLREFFRHYKSEELIKNRVECYIKHNSTLIAVDNENIAGAVQWQVKENPNAGVAELEEMFVTENYRKQGIGSELLKYLIEDVKQFFSSKGIKPRKIYLFVSKNNPAARKLYEKHGFKPIAEVNDLFTDNRNEVFYCLALQA